MSLTTTTIHPPTSSSPSPPTPSALTTLLSTQTSSTNPPPTEALPLEILHNLRHQHFWTSLRLHHHRPHSVNITSPSPASQPSARNSLPTQEDGGTILKPSISDLDLTSPHIKTATPAPPPPTKPASTPSSSSNPSPPPLTLISGIPPRSLYTHPDLQLKLLKAGIGTTVTEPNPQPLDPSQPEREWVLPTTISRKWTLRELCDVFDALPAKPPLQIQTQTQPQGRGKPVSPSPRPPAAEGSEAAAGEEEEERGGQEMHETRERADVEAGSTVKHQDAKRVLLAMKAPEGRGGDGTVVYYIVQEGEVKPRQN